MRQMLRQAVARTSVALIGNNSAGSHSLIYGKTIDHVMSLDLVLSNADEITASPISLEKLEVKKQGNTLEANIYLRVMPYL